MYLKVSISSWAGSWKDLTPEAYAELREAIPMLPEKKEDHPWKDLIVDDEQLRALSKHSVSVDLKPADDNCMLVKLQDRIASLGVQVSDLQEAIGHGCAAQIHVPDLALMHIREVTWLDDACTEQLQRYLDDGWRLLAVCPPNAQRRPDYILGRTTKEST